MNTSKLGVDLTTWKGPRGFGFIDYALLAGFLVVTLRELKPIASALLNSLAAWVSSLSAWLLSQPWS